MKIKISAILAVVLMAFVGATSLKAGNVESIIALHNYRNQTGQYESHNKALNEYRSSYGQYDQQQLQLVSCPAGDGYYGIQGEGNVFLHLVPEHEGFWKKFGKAILVGGIGGTTSGLLFKNGHPYFGSFVAGTTLSLISNGQEAKFKLVAHDLRAGRQSQEESENRQRLTDSERERRLDEAEARRNALRAEREAETEREAQVRQREVEEPIVEPAKPDVVEVMQVTFINKWQHRPVTLFYTAWDAECNCSVEKVESFLPNSFDESRTVEMVRGSTFKVIVNLTVNNDGGTDDQVFVVGRGIYPVLDHYEIWNPKTFAKVTGR